MCIRKVLLIGGFLVSVGIAQADMYLVKHEDIQVVRQLGFCR